MEVAFWKSLYGFIFLPLVKSTLAFRYVLRAISFLYIFISVNAPNLWPLIDKAKSLIGFKA